MNLGEFRDIYIKKIDDVNIKFIESLNIASKLKEAMMYSYTAGGKRLRPLLLLSTLYALDEDVNKGINTAASLELIHTSSLIHDDLPAMDNDDFRRGKLTNHKVYGEATAILAGDSLLVNSFQLITNDDLISSEVKLKLIDKLSACSGANGMIGGQQLDLENENKVIDIETIKKINLYKTGKLIEFALVAPAIIANLDNEYISSLEKISYHIGIAFQIKDDILDVIGNKSIIGKPVNSDKKNNKLTYVTELGLNKAEERLFHHYNTALNILNNLNIKSQLMEEIFNIIIYRNN